MTYWKYISKGIGVRVFGIVIGCMLLFWLVGLWMPELNSLVEIKYLAAIIGIPLIVFFIGNYVAWRKLK